jgi:hypothetical protein
MNKLIAALALMGIASSSLAGETLTRDQAVALMDECQAIRQQSIEIARQQELAACEAKSKRASDCDWLREPLQDNQNIGGRTLQTLFWDNPVCDQALKAEKYFRANPGKKKMKM